MASFFDSLSNVWSNLAPVIPQVASSYVQTSGNSDAAKQYANEQQHAADLLKGGYDKQLADYLNGIGEQDTLLRKGYTDETGQLQSATSDYAGDTRRALSTYSDNAYPAYQQYAGNMLDLGGDYANTINNVGNTASDMLGQTGQQFQEQYQPYLDAGGEALQGLRATAAQDPNQLTPSQRIAMEDSTRGVIANLASSGLRGAGRSGQAVIADDRRRLGANFFDANQGRSDRAIQQLSGQGYGATGAVANNQNQIGTQQAGIKYSTGTTGANRLYDVGSGVANQGYALANDINNKYLGNEGSIASNAYNTNKGIANLTGDLYSGLGGLTGNKAALTGAADINKAKADAAAVNSGAGVNLSVDTSNNNVWGNTLGKIGTAITGTVKNASYGSPATGGSSATPWEYNNPSPAATTYTVNGVEG